MGNNEFSKFKNSAGISIVDSTTVYFSEKKSSYKKSNSS